VLRRLVGKQLPPELEVKNILPEGLRKRYAQHREKVATERKDAASCFLVDINKTASWGGKPVCNKVSTILRSSKLVAIFQSSKDDRVIMRSELPAMHGIILPQKVVAGLSRQEMGSLIGNSMHVAQIGCFVQYALATREYVLPTGSD
jgi:hypothetical protein